MRYEDFLASKRHIPPPCGFEVDTATMNAHMFEWQKHQNVRFAIWKAIRNGGRFGCYEVVRLEEGE